MKFKDDEAKALWKEQVIINSVDSYSKGVIDYAEAWMNLMEKGLETGLELKNIWKDCSHQADTDGITGFMYRAATSIVAEVWFKGDELKQLHNADHGQPNAKGTINPALVTVDAPEGKEVGEVIKSAAKKAGLIIMNESEFDKILQKEKEFYAEDSPDRKTDKKSD